MSEPRWPEGKLGGEGVADPATAELARALKAAREREPDDMTLRRMWSRVAQPELLLPPAPVKRPRWISFVAGVGCTAALAGAAALWLLPRLDAKRAPVVATRPDAGVELRSAPTEGTVRTGAGERLQLGLAGGAEARLEGSTVMRIDRGGRPSVDGGEVAFSVAHPRPGHQVVVFAGPYRVVLAGARFKLRFDESRRVYVDAQDGVVEVWDRARVARLASGESWASPQPEGPPAPTTLALAEPTKESAKATTKPRVRDDAPGDDAAAAAQAALTAGDTSRALTLYRGLAKGAGPASENAAYEVGKILRDRLAQPTAAIAAWRRYREAHPAGVLRVEADVSIIETLAHAGETAGALAEANDFLRNHPDSERRGEIARVAGDLYRTRGEYRRAVAAYQLALSAPGNRSRDDAEPSTFHRAECLVRLGDPSGLEAARAYLRKWPTGRFSAEAERLLESGDGAGAARL